MAGVADLHRAIFDPQVDWFGRFPGKNDAIITGKFHLSREEAAALAVADGAGQR